MLGAHRTTGLNGEQHSKQHGQENCPKSCHSTSLMKTSEPQRPASTTAPPPAQRGLCSFLLLWGIIPDLKARPSASDWQSLGHVPRPSCNGHWERRCWHSQLLLWKMGSVPTKTHRKGIQKLDGPR